MNKFKEKINSHQPPGIDDFELLKPISKGAFGHVYLVRRRGTDKLFAMKAMRKTDVLNKNMIEQVAAERDALAVSKSPFVVQLFYSFQSKSNIFLVMEYLIGGDCKSLLHNLGYFGDEMARIYIAELTLALEYIHRHGIVHRDIKPDNMLISDQGHIKLTDFGLTRITRERKLNFHDLLQTPGTDKLITPSQRQRYWRTPGQIISLTSKFTFSVPRSKKKPNLDSKRLACVESTSESPLLSNSSSQSAYKFNVPSSRPARCMSSMRAGGKRYPSLSTPKTGNLHHKLYETSSGSGHEYSLPVKHIKFSSPTNEYDESHGSNVSHPVTNSIAKCTGLTAEFDNLLMKEDLRSCIKRGKEMAEKEELLIDNVEPLKKRVRLSSPVKFHLNSSSDDEITFNPKTFFSSDPIVSQSSLNDFVLKPVNEKQQSIAESNSSPFNSPGSHSSNSSVNWNVSGVTSLTDMTRTSIPTIDLDDSPIPQPRESAIKKSPIKAEQESLEIKTIDCLSPVNQSDLMNSENDGFSSPDASSLVFGFNESKELPSPMDVYEVDLDKFESSFSQLANSIASCPDVPTISTLPTTGSPPSVLSPLGLVVTDTAKSKSLSDERNLRQSLDMIERSLNDSGNLVGDGRDFVAEDCIMQSPASIGSRPHSRTGEVQMPSVFRTPANPGISKGEFQRKTPCRSPKSCRRAGEAKSTGCIVGTPDYLAPEILLDQEHGPSVDWWSLGICLYEFLTGIPPFHDETPELVFQHILSKDLLWPEGDESLSREAVDVIEKILARKVGDRFGAQEIKSHAYFASADWANLHKTAPPFVPNPDDAFDTTYFEARNNVLNFKISAFRL